MTKDYLIDKPVTKKSAIRASWFVVLFVIMFALLLSKFATSENSDSIFNGLPDSNTAYRIGRQFIQPTIRSTNVTFDDTDYKFAKPADSIYVIKSSYTEKFDDGEPATTRFTITLKYNGGQGNKQSNWTEIDFDKEDN